MKAFIILLGLLSVVSCKTSKDIATSNVPIDEGFKSDEEKVVLVEGKVRRILR